MSQKLVLAVATTAALVATTQAMSPPPIWRPKPTNPGATFDEESVDWNVNANAGNGGRWGVGVGLSGKFDEEQGIRGKFEEEQQLQKKIDWKKVVHAVDTGLDIWGKAKNVFSEEGPTSWELNGGASNGGNWNIGGKISGSFDEEDLQKLQFDLHKASKVLKTANNLGLFDEESELNEVQKLKLGKIVKSAVQVVKVAGAVGLLEESNQDAVETLGQLLQLYQKARQVGIFDEEQGPTSWELNGGASNGGKWNVGGKISGSFDEESLDWNANANIANGGQWKVGAGIGNTFGNGNGSWNLGGNVGNGGQWGVGAGVTWRFDEDESFPTRPVIGRGKVASFDEESLDWNANANIANGGQWKVGAGIGNTFGNGNGSWNLGGNVGNGGQWGVGAGVTWRFDEDEELPTTQRPQRPVKHTKHTKPQRPQRKPLLQRKKLQPITKQ